MVDPDKFRASRANPSASNPEDDEQIARRGVDENSSPVSPPLPTPLQRDLMSRPGRGYGVVPQALIERGMGGDQKRANRSAALQEIARLPVSRELSANLLPDDWEKTTPSELVDELRRAAWRHDVPLTEFARLIYQESKFLESDKLDSRRPIIMRSTNPRQPIGIAQMTTETLETLKRRAEARGDIARAEELKGYSLANRAQALDAAAEYLAYQRRTLGSWPAAAAAYNAGGEFMRDWLNGLDHSDDAHKYSRDPHAFRPNKWNGEVRNYLAVVFRGNPDEPPAYRIYDYRDPEESFRVPSPIARDPNAPDPWRISRDALQNL